MQKPVSGKQRVRSCAPARLGSSRASRVRLATMISFSGRVMVVVPFAVSLAAPQRRVVWLYDSASRAHMHWLGAATGLPPG
ncbi:MAG: hypothetical protein OHK0022_11010 [Roseiflexaceae bacterium]